MTANTDTQTTNNGSDPAPVAVPADNGAGGSPGNRVIPTPAPADLPSYKIVTKEGEIPDAYQVASIVVNKTVNKIPSAQIILLDGDVAKEEFEISNSKYFVPGHSIEIHAGYHDINEMIFKGVIIKHSLKIRKQKPSLLIIECRDEAFKMTVGRKSKYFYEASDGEIIDEIVDEYGLQRDIKPTDTSHPEMVQYYVTDWDFIVSRAEVNGKLVIVDDGSVALKTPDLNQDSLVILVLGATMTEFEADMDARDQLAAVNSYSWDYAEQVNIESEGKDPELTEAGNIAASELAQVSGLETLELRHTGQVVDSELKDWANARLLRSRLAKIRGRVKCQGFPSVKPGTVIELEGVGERFTGKVYVSGVRHQLTPENWQADIQFGLSAEWFSRNDDIIDVNAAGLVPAINGLHIGTVVSLEGDPDGEHRVQVRLPIIDEEEDGVWARVCTLDAGEERGSFFRPELKDEVIVGFLNDDPRDAVILGMLNSTAKPAPLEAENPNPIKGFVTRSQMKFLFDDDKVEVTLNTPNGNSVTLSDDDESIVIVDQHNNSITMNDSGITADSPFDINITAKGDINIKGANVTIEAKQQFTSKGNSGAEMSTPAVAVVKGSVVQIN